MAANYVLLASQTVGEAGASSVTFSNIPQTGYTDLKIVGSARTTASAFYGYLAHKLNNSGTGYTAKAVDAYAGTVYSETGPTDLIRIDVNGNTSTSSTFGSYELYIPNYTSSNYKSYSYDWATENNSTSVYLGLTAGLWSNATAISSIVITPDTGTIMQYSSFYLYGIAASGVTPVIAPFATGGNVTNDGTYWIHTFLASGTFTPFKTLSCDYLVVAGGGGGGADQTSVGGAGGGGAGGFKTSTAFSVSGAVTVTVGAGGAGATASGVGGSGGNSVLSSITSTGGGGGSGISSTLPGADGGSGGGGNGNYNTAGGSASPSGQGNAGGVGGNNYGGGGGGASAVGATGTASGNGGAGTSNSYSGAAVTYAGGGGGGSYSTSTAGTGGAGGGGNGKGTSQALTAGTANTGGGGGGAGGNANLSGAAGGSGIVIVRYAMV
jgi:hypothetical protein